MSKKGGRGPGGDEGVDAPEPLKDGDFWFLGDAGTLWIGKGGWAFWKVNMGGEVRLRFGTRDDGRIEIKEVYVVRERGVSARFMRDLPLGRLETMVNSSAVKGKQFRELIEATWTEGDVVEEAAWAVAETLPDPDDPLHELEFDPTVPGADVRRKSDDFYAAVAEKYSGIAARGEPAPAKALARANDVPVSTVNWWIKQARRRGLLPPGR